MSRLRSAALAAMLASLVGAVAGCSGSSPGPQPALTFATTPIFTAPSPSSTTLSPEEQNIADAEKTVKQFWVIQDALGQDANLAISQLLKVLRGTAYETWSQEIQSRRARQLRQIGDSQLLSVRGAVAPTKARTTVTVTICYDVSKVDVVDKNGKSVVTKERADQAKAIYTVERWTDGWFITDDDTRGKPCDA